MPSCILAALFQVVVLPSHLLLGSKIHFPKLVACTGDIYLVLPSPPAAALLSLVSLKMNYVSVTCESRRKEAVFRTKKKHLDLSSNLQVRVILIWFCGVQIGLAQHYDVSNSANYALTSVKNFAATETLREENNE